MKILTDSTITMAQLTADPYSIYTRLRAECPVVKVPAVGRTLITKAQHVRHVKMNPELFSSDDPNTPMERAFQAKTLMRRDGKDHMRLRTAMMPALSPAKVKQVWSEQVERIADEYVSRLQRGETVDLFTAFAGPFSARCLAVVLGLPQSSDEDIQRWSQTLIDGAGNFSGIQELFNRADQVNDEINASIAKSIRVGRENDEHSALAVQAYAEHPLEMEHIISNIKIAIGGGINEPRDSILTTVYALLANPEQRAEVQNDVVLFGKAFDEAVRWVAPIQVSTRRATQDTVIGEYALAKDEVLLTVQASANHDEDEYEDGHLFNLFRNEQRHQSFGNGPHFCMGTHLSRKMVGDIALPKLFERFPNMRLSDHSAVVWSGFGFRGPLSLPVVLN